MRRFAAAAALVALAGCGDGGLAARQAELAHWVGQPEVALVQAMGAPNRVYETDKMKFLTYEEHRIQVSPGLPYYEPSGYFVTGGGFPSSVFDLRCDTTFTVVGGVVRAYGLRGNACG